MAPGVRDDLGRGSGEGKWLPQDQLLPPESELIDLGEVEVYSL